MLTGYFDVLVLQLFLNVDLFFCVVIFCFGVPMSEIGNALYTELASSCVPVKLPEVTPENELADGIAVGIAPALYTLYRYIQDLHKIIAEMKEKLNNE